MMNRYSSDRARRQSAALRGQGPTLEDYHTLAEQYQKLQAVNERQSAALAEAEKQLRIKSDALAMQNEDISKLSAELAFARAALQQQDESEAAAEAEDAVNWQERYARMQAEQENLRKRWEQRLAIEVAQMRHRILLDMLPLADHLEMAIRHADSNEDVVQDGVVENLRATQRAFLDTLKRYNVTPLETKGQKFDPSLHEAIGQIASDEAAEGEVAEVLQTGYLEGDTLLRAARVMVSSGASA